MLRPAGTVVSAASLRASTFYHMYNSGWREQENLLLGLTSRFPHSFHPYSVACGRCHCHPNITLEISSVCTSPSVLLGNSSSQCAGITVQKQFNTQGPEIAPKYAFKYQQAQLLLRNSASATNQNLPDGPIWYAVLKSHFK